MLILCVDFFACWEVKIIVRETLADYCRRTDRGDLLEEWDFERNHPLTPDTISYGSKKHVWWRCANGHRWQAAIYTRTGSGAGCPSCSGRLAIPGETDLATCYSDLAREWHSEKNGSLTPDQVLPGSHRIVGAVSTAMSGRRKSNPASMALAAPSAPTNRCRLATMTSLASIQTLRASGILRKMVPSLRRTWCPAHGAKSGGNARKATTTKPALPAVSMAAAAPSVQEKSLFQVKTI